VIFDVPDDQVAALVGAIEGLGLAVNPTPFRRGMMACTGLEFCKLAMVETKARANDLYAELEKRLPDFDTPITINVNGCPNACARFQVADIGLKGMIVDDGEGFQVHLGGAIGDDSGLGRKVRGLKVRTEDLPDYIERVLRNYVKHRDEGERFATWVRRADEDLVQ
jgi:sulfite reductase (ferredoxin)